jgi:hypothetical protein
VSQEKVRNLRLNQKPKRSKHSARLETREAKAKMKEVQAKYNAVLKEYYLNRSSFAVARDALNRTWSTGEYLPKEVKQKLDELQREFSSLSTDYENALKYELDLRELRRAGMGVNLEVSSLSADGKLVGTLLDDRLSVGVFKKEQAAIEQAKAERDVEKSKTLTGRVMVGIKKHPGKLKTVRLLTAASIGFATGGLFGMAAGATRFATSVALGGLTAIKIYELSQEAVDKNKNYLDALMVPRSKEEVEGLTREDRTKMLRIANAQLEQAKLRQVAKAATAAALVGGVYNGSFAAVDSLIAPTPSPAVMPYPDSGLGAEAQSAIEAAAEREMEDMATASLSPEAVPAISSIDLINKIELDTSSAIAGNDTVINDVKLNGVGLSSIDSAQTILLLSEIKQQAGDILWDAPRLNKFELENLINSRLESKFGSQDWWPQSSGIKVEFGSIELAEDLQRDREILTEMGQTDFGSVDAEDAESVREYQIKQGDNLTNIVKSELAAKLEGVPAARREAVLANLFERINNNTELKTELGIKADVNKIYSGDKLNLGVLERELEKETLVDNFRKSGALGVESDSATKNVPIKVTESALERGTKITISDGLGDRAYVEEKPVLPRPVPAGIKEFSPAVSPEVYQNLKLPTTLPVTGQYMDNVGINDQIAKIFQGGPNGFEREVMNAVNDYDNRTYDPLNRLFGGFTSPYMLLGDMSLEKYYNYIDMPNAELRQDLASQGIKYETFVSWSDKITELQGRFPHTEKTTIGDLMKRAVLEDRLSALKNK